MEGHGGEPKDNGKCVIELLEQCEREFGDLALSIEGHAMKFFPPGNPTRTGRFFCLLSDGK